MQRVKDPERFLAELERPLDGIGPRVTDQDLERDGESFIAFAAAMGIKPPSSPPAASA